MHLELQWKAIHWSGSYALWLLSALTGFPVFTASRPPVHNSQLNVEGGPCLDGDEFTKGLWRPQTAALGQREHGSKDHNGWERLPPGMVRWHSSWKRNGHWQMSHKQEHGGPEHGKRTMVPRATLLHVGNSQVSAKVLEQRVPHVTALVPGSAMQIEEATEAVSAGVSHTSGCQDTQDPTAVLMPPGASCHIDCACELFGGICLNQQHCAIMFFFIVIAGFSCAIVALTWCSAKRSRSILTEPDCGAPAPVLPPPEAAPPDRPLGQTLAEKVGSKPVLLDDPQTAGSAKAPVFRGTANRRENGRNSADSISASG